MQETRRSAAACVTRERLSPARRRRPRPECILVTQRRADGLCSPVANARDALFRSGVRDKGAPISCTSSPSAPGAHPRDGARSGRARSARLSRMPETHRSAAPIVTGERPSPARRRRPRPERIPVTGRGAGGRALLACHECRRHAVPQVHSRQGSEHDAACASPHDSRDGSRGRGRERVSGAFTGSRAVFHVKHGPNAWRCEQAPPGSIRREHPGRRRRRFRPCNA
jgi:hypothetical protein